MPETRGVRLRAQSPGTTAPPLFTTLYGTSYDLLVCIHVIASLASFDTYTVTYGASQLSLVACGACRHFRMRFSPLASRGLQVSTCATPPRVAPHPSIV